MASRVLRCLKLSNRAKVGEALGSEDPSVEGVPKLQCMWAVT